VALDAPEYALQYWVFAEFVRASGDAGDIVISDRAVNGFKIAYTGSAAQAEIRYCVIGESGIAFG
jgi:hypothetical protein